MLQNLRIKNFALIEDLEMQCSPGLNVLTGETGAGKSILIDALNILLGEKAGPAFIRLGTEKAIIEGIFSAKPAIICWLKEKELLDDSEVQKQVNENNAPENDAGEVLVTGEVLITREITKTGSRFRINSILSNQATVNELKQLLIHVHAQHESRTLLSAQSQLDILDNLGDTKHLNTIREIEVLYSEKTALTQELNNLQMSEQERVRKLDFARFQLDELQIANLKEADEDEQLEKKQMLLANIAQLDLAANNAYQALIGGNDNAEASESSISTGAIDNLQMALSNLEKAVKFDSALEPIIETFANSLSLLEDAQSNLRHYKDSLDTDPEALQEIEARIAQLATVKRKYGPTLDKAIEKATSLQEDIEQLENAQSETNKLQAKLDSINKEMARLAKTLSETRYILAKKLISAMQNELSQLGMENCRFEINFEKMADIGGSGYDRIEFMISPNPGQPLLPLAKIASGGELSRIMLALKSIVTSQNDPSTVIFDEIDSGLSGRIVQAVRDKLVKLAKLRQILCITHQPIIAAAANNHLFIEKEHTKETTNVTIKVLAGEDRIKALAAMASGDANEIVALDFAKALIDR